MTTTTVTESDNSKQQRRWPKAAMLAVVFVAIAELGMRSLPLESVIRTDMGTTEYLAVRAAIQSDMTRDFVFAGSSRVLQGIVLEDFSSSLHERAPGDWRVGSYAINGALSAETLAVLDFMLEHPEHQPRVIAWGLTIDEIRGEELVTDRSMLFYPLEKYRTERKQLGAVVAPYRSDAIRTELSEYSLLYRYHFLPVIYIKDFGRNPQPRAFLGESFGRHTADEGVLEDTEELRERIRDRYRDWHFYEADYQFSEAKLERIRALLRKCREKDVQVCLFEVPNAPPFDIELPPRLHTMIKQTLTELAAETGIPVVWVKDLGVEFHTSDFYDTVHLNFEGAKRLTLALADHIPEAVTEHLIQTAR
ncbi:MAG: SGNH/GDSL hydrolase family protein [Planctomycetales bacterium]|nr:SGNH/GDSL hydrolase family protein [Planctomycetales bacterium]